MIDKKTEVQIVILLELLGESYSIRLMTSSSKTLIEFVTSSTKSEMTLDMLMRLLDAAKPMMTQAQRNLVNDFISKVSPVNVVPACLTAPPQQQVPLIPNPQEAYVDPSYYGY